MGAEIGISTDKLHARGPMGLEELTTYKYGGRRRPGAGINGRQFAPARTNIIVISRPMV